MTCLDIKYEFFSIELLSFYQPKELKDHFFKQGYKLVY